MECSGEHFQEWGLLRRLFKTCSTNLKRHGHPESAHGNSFRRSAGYSKTLPELRSLCLLRRRLILKADWSKDGVRKALEDRQKVISELLDAIRGYRKLADQPLT